MLQHLDFSNLAALVLGVQKFDLESRLVRYDDLPKSTMGTHSES